MTFIILILLMGLWFYQPRSFYRSIMWVMAACLGFTLSSCASPSADIVAALAKDQAAACARAEVTTPWGHTSVAACRDNSGAGVTDKITPDGTMEMSRTAVTTPTRETPNP